MKKKKKLMLVGISITFLFLLILLIPFGVRQYQGYQVRESRTEKFWYPTKVLIKRTDAVIPHGWGSISVAYFEYSDGSWEKVYATERKFTYQVGETLGRVAKKYFLIIRKIDIGEEKIKLSLDDGSIEKFCEGDPVFESLKSAQVGDTLFITKY